MKRLFIFLNQKLVSCDVIMPLVLEAQARGFIGKTVFLAADQDTADHIKQNVLLRDSISAVGTLKSFRNRKGVAGKLFRKAEIALWCVGLAAYLTWTGNKIIHFRELEYWPWRLIYVVNRRRTFLSEGIGIGFSERELRAASINRPMRKRREFTSAGALIAFSRDWHMTRMPWTKDMPQYFIGSPHRRAFWFEYVEERAAAYLERDFNEAGLDSPRRIFAIMLQDFIPFGKLSGPDAMRRCFLDTIEVLEAYSPDIPIVLKPHMITDIKEVRGLLEGRQGKFLVSYLHPSILATRSVCFIANMYSTALTNAKFANVPTIEYTSYNSEALAITDGGSVRPDIVDHFINEDKQALSRLVSQLVQESKVTRSNDISDLDAKPLFRALAS